MFNAVVYNNYCTKGYMTNCFLMCIIMPIVLFRETINSYVSYLSNRKTKIN